MIASDVLLADSVVSVRSLAVDLLGFSMSQDRSLWIRLSPCRLGPPDRLFMEVASGGLGSLILGRVGLGVGLSVEACVLAGHQPFVSPARRVLGPALEQP